MAAAADADEIPLRGGRMTPGVVRAGDTVRRPATANSGFVRDLLRHLAAKRFEGAPGYCGTDARGRDILSFVAGEVPAELGFHDDATLAAAARLIRRFHDAGADLVDTADGIEVVCHNDLSPCNFVFRDGAPVALIDFDAAAPGLRADDLGYAAWLWLDIGSDEIAPAEQARRLALFLAAYGMDDPPASSPRCFAGRPPSRPTARAAATARWPTGPPPAAPGRARTRRSSPEAEPEGASSAQISAPGGVVQVESLARFQAREVHVSLGFGVPPGPSIAS